MSLPFSSALVALQRRVPGADGGDEQAEAEQGTGSFRSVQLDMGDSRLQQQVVAFNEAHRWLCVPPLPAGVHGLQEGEGQDADVPQEPAPTGVQLLERARAAGGAQHLWAQVLPAQGEEQSEPCLCMCVCTRNGMNRIKFKTIIPLPHTFCNNRIVPTLLL